MASNGLQYCSMMLTRRTSVEFSSLSSPAVLVAPPGEIQASAGGWRGAPANSGAWRASSSIRRSRSVPFVGGGGVTLGSNRSKVAANRSDELLKWGERGGRGTL